SQSGRQTPAFQRFLRDNTSMDRRNIAPIDLDFVKPLTPVPDPPDVYLFVVDSLRADYLAPYNRAVTFTPRIAQFANESLVFRPAITRYGAPGLSLPSIWSGAVGVHKQYVTPFAPMNTLEKLLDVNNYRRLMDVDVLMPELLKPNANTVELIAGRRR